MLWNNPAGSEPSGLLIVPVKDDVKMLGIRIDNKLSFIKQYEHVLKKLKDT